MAPQKYTLLPTSEQTQTVTKTSNSTCFYLLVLANLVIFVILFHLNSVPQNIQVNFADNRISQYIKDSNIERVCKIVKMFKNKFNHEQIWKAKTVACTAHGSCLRVSFFHISLFRTILIK